MLLPLPRNSCLKFYSLPLSPLVPLPTPYLSLSPPSLPLSISSLCGTASLHHCSFLSSAFLVTLCAELCRSVHHRRTVSHMPHLSLLYVSLSPVSVSLALVSLPRPGSPPSPASLPLSHARTQALKGSPGGGLAPRQAGDPRAAGTPRSPLGTDSSAVPGPAGPPSPSAAAAGGGRWAGDSPKRAGAGSFLRNSQRRIPARGCPLPLTKYGAARPPERRVAREGPQRRVRGVLHRRPSWSLPHPLNQAHLVLTPQNTQDRPRPLAALGGVGRRPVCLTQSPRPTRAAATSSWRGWGEGERSGRPLRGSVLGICPVLFHKPSPAKQVR